MGTATVHRLSRKKYLDEDVDTFCHLVYEALDIPWEHRIYSNLPVRDVKPERKKSKRRRAKP